MSEQELSNLMNEAAVGNALDIVTANAPVSASDVNLGEPKETTNSVKVSDCIDIYDFISSHPGLIKGWKKVRLYSVDGNEISDTHKVLVGINDEGCPIIFDCNNLHFPKQYVDGVNDIRVLVSGIIMTSDNADIYVTKNNVFIYVKDNNTHGRYKMIKYIKAKHNAATFKETLRDDSKEVDAEYAKFVIMAVGGRLYNNIAEVTDLETIKTTVLKFMTEKVADINYRIRIEDVCLQLGF